MDKHNVRTTWVTPHLIVASPMRITKKSYLCMYETLCINEGINQYGVQVYVHKYGTNLEAKNIQGESKKMSPLTKCDTIAPHLEINEIRFRHIDPDVHADMWYKNGIDWSRNAWAMSAWKRRTTFAPTQGLHISGYVPSRHRYCKSHISAYEWKIWIITTRQLRVYVTLCFPYFSHPYFIKAMESHIG